MWNGPCPSLSKLSSVTKSNNPTFARRPVERADWSLFRTLEGLQQRAGVPLDKLAGVVLKELADSGRILKIARDGGVAGKVKS